MSIIPDLTYEYILGAVPIWGKPNTYFGSAPLKENSGVFDNQFRYRITLIVDNENGHKVSASYYIGWKSYDCTDPEEITEETFSGDDEGTAQAINWLRERLEEAVKGNNC